jgi:hypothetical protein
MMIGHNLALKIPALTGLLRGPGPLWNILLAGKIKVNTETVGTMIEHLNTKEGWVIEQVVQDTGILLVVHKTGNIKPKDI